MAGGESKNDRNAKNSAERSSVKYIQSVIHFLPAKQTNTFIHYLSGQQTNKQTDRNVRDLYFGNIIYIYYVGL
jgi:hypothetical protein